MLEEEMEEIRQKSAHKSVRKGGKKKFGQNIEERKDHAWLSC